MNKRIISIILTLIVLLFGCVSCTADFDYDISESNSSTSVSATPTAPTTQTVTHPISDNGEYTFDMKVHFIDVGQGDSIFIELPNGNTMLIDAGETDQGQKVASYISSLGYSALDYVVATHPHSDHIGGMAKVINSFTVQNFYMTSALSTTAAYENMLNAVDSSDAAVHSVMAGDIICNDKNLLIEIVAPKSLDTDNLNDTSIVIKLTYGEKSFLFTGDAEKAEEDAIWTNIKCDVLKLGHHGSSTSTSDNFLKKVEPEYAVISVGVNNSYGHPADDVLRRLDQNNLKVYRTDLQGTVIFITDGKNISVNTQQTEYTPPVVTTTQTAANSSTTYVLNTNSKKIHYSYCNSVKDMKESNKAFTTDYDKAIADGYKPCGNCKP